VKKWRTYIQILLLFLSGIISYLRLKRYLYFAYKKEFSAIGWTLEEYKYHSKQYNRTKQYVHANYFFGEWLSLYRGFALNPTELKKFVWLSSCAPVFDDFFEHSYDYDHIKNLLLHPVLSNARNSKEDLAVWFFSKILENNTDSQQLQDTALELFDAQIRSKNQENAAIVYEDLIKISKDKGGFSGLMYAHLLDYRKTDGFKQYAFQLGAYGQLMDDVFDLFDDAKNGIYTFANRSKDVKSIRNVVSDHEKTVEMLIVAASLPENRKIRIKRVLGIFGAVIETALQHYEHIEKEHKIPPCESQGTERKLWIVDMEKISTIRKMFSIAMKTF
jgi:hypothetical protein